MTNIRGRDTIVLSCISDLDIYRYGLKIFRCGAGWFFIIARDIMPEGGTLTFATDIETLDTAFCKSHNHEIAPDRFLHISITDTGTDINQETRKHIFEPFFTTKPCGKGDPIKPGAWVKPRSVAQNARTLHSRRAVQFVKGRWTFCPAARPHLRTMVWGAGV